MQLKQPELGLPGPSRPVRVRSTHDGLHDNRTLAARAGPQAVDLLRAKWPPRWRGPCGSGSGPNQGALSAGVALCVSSGSGTEGPPCEGLPGARLLIREAPRK